MAEAIVPSSSSRLPPGRWRRRSRRCRRWPPTTTCAAVRLQPVVAWLCRRAGAHGAGPLGRGRGAGPAGLAGRGRPAGAAAGPAALPDLGPVLRGADRGGRAGHVAGGHADVRGGPAPVLLALPGRGAHPARHRGRAEPGRRRPGLVAAAAPGGHRSLGGRDLYLPVPDLGADGPPGHAGHRGPGRGWPGSSTRGPGTGSPRRWRGARWNGRRTPGTGGPRCSGSGGRCGTGPAGCLSRRWPR